jgi:hypothetical protein
VATSAQMSGFGVNQDLAPLRTVDYSAVNTNESKLFELIGIPDLERHPVWESILDDEADELSVFAVRDLPVTNLEGRFVGTRVQLANGDLHWAMLFYIDVNDSRKTEQFLSLRIERGGNWFNLARYWDVDYQRSGPEALASFLGLPLEEIFPISYDVREYSMGDPGTLADQIPKQPRERLPEDVIIKMLVR